MLFCLTAYGMRGTGTAPMRRPATPQNVRPLSPLNPSAMKERDSRPLRDRQHAVAEAVQKQEEQIIAQLGLSAAQMIAYSELRRSVDQTPADDQSGAAMNALQSSAKFRDGLQQIFASDQYRRYR